LRDARRLAGYFAFCKFCRPPGRGWPSSFSPYADISLIFPVGAAFALTAADDFLVTGASGNRNEL
jgi:hypothetical protein